MIEGGKENIIIGEEEIGGVNHSEQPVCSAARLRRNTKELERMQCL